MGKAIINGFPLRRCSWVFDPIIPGILGRRMIHWLDAVCLAAKHRKLASLPNREHPQELKSLDEP